MTVTPAGRSAGPSLSQCRCRTAKSARLDVINQSRPGVRVYHCRSAGQRPTGSVVKRHSLPADSVVKRHSFGRHNGKTFDLFSNFRPESIILLPTFFATVHALHKLQTRNDKRLKTWQQSYLSSCYNLQPCDHSILSKESVGSPGYFWKYIGQLYL